ncbi:MAG: type II/IV secretion system protein, partial [Actinomycetota bacterium]
MGSLLHHPLPACGALDPGQLKAARERAAASGRRIVAELEEIIALPPADFLQALAATLRYPAVDGVALFASAPDFGAITLAEALHRECAVVRLAGGERVGVFADPFDDALQAWLDARLDGSPLHLVHPADLASFLARQEEEFRAVENVATGTGESAGADDAVENLSLVRISEDSSVVVKLVNSTLYDALKARAS